MRRRKFIAALGGAAIAWPLEARAQHSDRVRRIGVLMGYAKNDPVYQSWFATFKARLSAANRNLQIDDRWVSANVTSIDDAANEIIALKPEVIFASTTPVVAALKRRTSTIPVVFAIVSDPLGAGFVDSLAHPGGNITGFINVESSMGGKWLYLLKEVAPTITHAAIMFNPATAPRGGDFFLPSFDEAGRKLSMRTSAATVHNSGEISSAIVDLVQSPGGGLVIMSDSFMSVHREEVMGRRTCTSCRSSGGLARLPKQALCSVTPQILAKCSAARPVTSSAFLRAKSHQTFRCRNRQNSSLS